MYHPSCVLSVSLLHFTGEKYLGQWFRDVKQGPGLHITLDGYYMEGNFVNNKIMECFVTISWQIC